MSLPAPSAPPSDIALPSYDTSAEFGFGHKHEHAGPREMKLYSVKMIQLSRSSWIACHLLLGALHHYAE